MTTNGEWVAEIERLRRDLDAYKKQRAEDIERANASIERENKLRADFVAAAAEIKDLRATIYRYEGVIDLTKMGEVVLAEKLFEAERRLKWFEELASWHRAEAERLDSVVPRVQVPEVYSACAEVHRRASEKIHETLKRGTEPGAST